MTVIYIHLETTEIKLIVALTPPVSPVGSNVQYLVLRSLIDQLYQLFHHLPPFSDIDGPVSEFLSFRAFPFVTTLHVCNGALHSM